MGLEPFVLGECPAHVFVLLLLLSVCSRDVNTLLCSFESLLLCFVGCMIRIVHRPSHLLLHHGIHSVPGTIISVCVRVCTIMVEPRTIDRLDVGTQL